MQSKFKHIILLIFCFFLWHLTAQAQDYHLSQFYETPLLRNPALAGIFTGDIRVQALYRNQWNSIEYPYQTAALSGEYRFKIDDASDYVTTALQLLYDVAGSTQLSTTAVLPAVNFHKSLSAEKSMYLSVGFMGGFIQTQFDPNNLTFDSQYQGNGYNPYVPSGEIFSDFRRVYWDAATGISFNSQAGENVNYFLGASCYHFNKPKESFLGDKTIYLQPKWEFNGGISITLNDYVKINAEANWLKQGSYQEEMGGAIIMYDFSAGNADETNSVVVGGGLFLRYQDAVIPVIKLGYKKIEMGLSYDTNISSLKTASEGRGGFELSLSYKGFLHDTRPGMSEVRCPRF